MRLTSDRSGVEVPPGPPHNTSMSSKVTALLTFGVAAMGPPVSNAARCDAQMRKGRSGGFALGGEIP
jgi:hypothetical protein